MRRSRERKHLTLLDVEAKLGIRAKYLAALEEGRYSALPKGVYSRGFLLSYADFLGLSKEKVLELWQKEEKSLCAEPPKFKTEVLPQTQGFYLSPRLVLVAMVLILTIGVLGFVFYQVRDLISAPSLEILSPADETVVEGDTVVVEGKTESGNSVRINDQPVAVDSEGKFQRQVYLFTGVNLIEITAENKTQKTSKKTLIVGSKTKEEFARTSSYAQ